MINDFLKREVLKSGLSLYFIAKHLGIDEGNLRAVMKGKRGFSMNLADKICELLDISLVVNPNRTLPEQPPCGVPKGYKRKNLAGPGNSTRIIRGTAWEMNFQTNMTPAGKYLKGTDRGQKST